MLSAEAMKAVMAGTLSPVTAWRKAAGLSQAALAERIGIRTATLNEIETGKTDPRVSTMKAIAAALSGDLDDLVT
jgi:transcriptional regulator with XRE-family HTH domain